MTAIHNVKLELLRPGPAHNQLLSPLTPYIALCGAAGPVTVNLPFEHRQLLNRLERLRYVTNSGEITIEQEQFEVRDIGESLGRLLGQIPSLAPEIGRAHCADQGLVHLRLSVSALELSLVPFELAVAPEGFPGSGSPLFLQSNTPITITREVRRGQPLPVKWDRKPRILFAYAQPGSVAPVPATEHLKALRRAIDPWVKWAATDKERLPEIKSILTVLPDASLEKIRDECTRTEYTHVHILAHGAPMPKGDLRFGLALADHRDPSEMNIIDGETLAVALTGSGDSACPGRRPTFVSLATCDSGQAGSVFTPGGSLAHELNAAGIPWVIASQFPLGMWASTILVDMLYSGILLGEDPRWVLYKTRQRLRTDVLATHDWASIVAYATVPWDFEKQVEAFRNQQVRAAVEVSFDEAEKRTAIEGPGSESLKTLYGEIRQKLTTWCSEATKDNERSERLGVAAAAEKRIGALHAGANGEKEAETEAYQQARDLYQRALEANPVNHWVVTQYLSMLTVLSNVKDYPKLAKEHESMWSAAREIANWSLRGAAGEKAAWALGTLAELELLGVVFGRPRLNKDEAIDQVTKHCERLVEAVGADAFEVFSTRRQFQRYVEPWHREVWAKIAQAALECLPESPVWVGRAASPKKKAGVARRKRKV